MSGKVKIRIENLSKIWGTTKAIDNLTIDIHEGDFLTLLGPSGCGKTTTLRSIAGLENPTEGKITINDKVVFSKKDEVYVDPVKRDIGLIFQSYALWPHMTVMKNVAFGPTIKKLPKNEVEKLTMDILKKVHLENHAHRYPNELSGGQQQRVAIARMLIAKPGIFLMDEPLSNLDAKLRLEMRSEVKRLHQEAGTTTVYVTHDQEEAMTMSSHICIMKDGVILQKDTPEMLYRKPADLFVADFISNPKMNFIDGDVIRENGKAHVNAKGFILPVESDLIGDRKYVKVAFRPEDAELNQNGVAFRIETQLPTGPAQINNLYNEHCTVTMITKNYVRSKPGETIKIGIKLDCHNIFDIETGKRIF